MRRPRLPLEHLLKVTRDAFTAARQAASSDIHLAMLLEEERQVLSRLIRPRARKARLRRPAP